MPDSRKQVTRQHADHGVLGQEEGLGMERANDGVQPLHGQETGHHVRPVPGHRGSVDGDVEEVGQVDRVGHRVLHGGGHDLLHNVGQHEQQLRRADAHHIGAGAAAHGRVKEDDDVEGGQRQGDDDGAEVDDLHDGDRQVTLFRAQELVRFRRI